MRRFPFLRNFTPVMSTNQSTDPCLAFISQSDSFAFHRASQLCLQFSLHRCTAATSAPSVVRTGGTTQVLGHWGPELQTRSSQSGRVGGKGTASWNRFRQSNFTQTLLCAQNTWDTVYRASPIPMAQTWTPPPGPRQISILALLVSGWR